MKTSDKIMYAALVAAATYFVARFAIGTIYGI
jgi:hypothetical protein